MSNLKAIDLTSDEWDWLSDDLDYEPSPFELLTDPEVEALRSLDMVAELLPRADDDIYMWKWIIIALHGATQAYMVLALRGTSPARLLKPSATKKYLAVARSGDYSRLSKSYYMDDFMGLFRKLQDESMMLVYTGSTCFAPSVTVLGSMEQMVAMRNTFIHFLISGLTQDVRRLPQVVADAVEVIDFVTFKSGNVFSISQAGLHSRTRELLDRIGTETRRLEATFAAFEHRP